MKTLIVTAALTAAMIAPAAAETWIAICNDGQNLQYNQTIDGNGFLYLRPGGSGGLQMARLEQTFFNGIAVCGAVPGNGTGSAATGGHPITQLCANKSRGNIYIQYKHPTEDRDFEASVFCSATVDVR